jgi:hypothetical protein
MVQLVARQAPPSVLRDSYLSKFIDQKLSAVGFEPFFKGVGRGSTVVAMGGR